MAEHDLPYFLQSYDNLKTHFDEQFEGLSSQDRGSSFVELAHKLLPFTEPGRRFPSISISPKHSYDEGVDIFTSENDEGDALFAQSKYKIRGKDDFDSIISKFQGYENTLLAQRGAVDLFDSLEQEKGANRNPRYIFVVITSTKMKGVLDNYERSMLALRAYYNQLIQEGRLDVIDGPRILDILQQLYRKTHLLPTDVILTSYNGWLQAGAVRIGFVSGKEIVELHAKHGDALFFENIRDFLGVDDGKKTERTTVNQEISRTIHQDPARMLERNNGLTFRAASVEVVDEFRLVLKNGAIANGCQTTMCLVHAGKAAETCLIQTKIVETLNGWDVAHAANYQNPVARIDLDLARYLRPQIIQKAAIDAGFGGTEGIFNAANQVLSAVHQNRINYEETKALYLGIFSNSPRNLFERNYTEVRGDMLVQIYQIMGMDDIFATLFLVVGASREAGSRCRATFKGAEYASLFKRVYDDEKPNYRMYLAILALCGSLRVDISNKETGTEKEAMRIREFLTRSREMIENERGRYIINYVKAFHVVADYVMELPTEASIISNLHNKFVQTRFEVFYRKLLIKIDVDAALYEQP